MPMGWPKPLPPKPPAMAPPIAPPMAPAPAPPAFCESRADTKRTNEWTDEGS